MLPLKCGFGISYGIDPHCPFRKFVVIVWVKMGFHILYIEQCCDICDESHDGADTRHIQKFAVPSRIHKGHWPSRYRENEGVGGSERCGQYQV